MDWLKNIIFDMGDVLLEYRWAEALRDIGETPEEAERISAEAVNSRLWPLMDLGILSTKETAEKLSILYPEDRRQITWFFSHPEHLVVTRPEVWEKLYRLKEQGYGIYVLSNYCSEFWKAHVEPQPFFEKLDGFVVSYVVHRLKPDEVMYRTLLERYGLKPEECCFFDDRTENVRGGMKLGIAGVPVTGRKFLNEMLEKLIQGGPETLPLLR